MGAKALYKKRAICLHANALWQTKTKQEIGVMLERLCARLVTALIFALAATGSRADNSAIICTNVSALNSQFVVLLAEHLGFEPNVVINRRPQDAASDDNAGTVYLVISGQPYKAVVACAVGHKFERDELNQKIRELHSQLGKEGQPVFPEGPRGVVRSAGEAVKVNGQQFFISVSDDDSLVAAAAAVAQSHNADIDACWFDNACLVASETYWSLKAD